MMNFCRFISIILFHGEKINTLFEVVIDKARGFVYYCFVEKIFTVLYVKTQTERTPRLAINESKTAIYRKPTVLGDYYERTL